MERDRERWRREVVFVMCRCLVREENLVRWWDFGERVREFVWDFKKRKGRRGGVGWSGADGGWDL